MYTIKIGSPVHVIAGTDTGINFTPSSHFLFQSLYPYQFLPDRTGYPAFARYRIKTYQTGYGCLSILQHRLEIRHRINIFSRIGLPKFQMKMRTGRSPLVTAQRQQLSLLHRELTGFEVQIACERLMLILIRPDILLNFRCKRNHMSIHRSQSIGMSHKNGLPVSSVKYHYPGNITVGNATDRLTGHSLCLNVQTVMKMVRTEFPEVGTQQQREIKRGTKYIFIYLLSLYTGPHDQRQHQPYHFSYHDCLSVFSLFFSTRRTTRMLASYSKTIGKATISKVNTSEVGVMTAAITSTTTMACFR